MVLIDDATDRITAAQFAPTEDSLGYRELIEQHVWRYVRWLSTVIVTAFSLRLVIIEHWLEITN